MMRIVENLPRNCMIHKHNLYCRSVVVVYFFSD